MAKMGLKIILIGGLEITTQDSYTEHGEDMAIEQMTSYGKHGYYSRVRKVYFPPSQIERIILFTTE